MSLMDEIQNAKIEDLIEFKRYMNDACMPDLSVVPPAFDVVTNEPDRNVREAKRIIKQRKEGNGMTTEQKKLLVSIDGLRAQIEKSHFLNAHFRAFEIANDCWREHIRMNALSGARACGSPAGAVLDDDRLSVVCSGKVPTGGAIGTIKPVCQGGGVTP